MGTKRNNIDHLVKKLRSESLYSDKATLETMNLCMEAALVIERQECTNKALYAELAEKDKQLAAAVEDIKKPSVCDCCKRNGCSDPIGCIDNQYMYFEWKGPRAKEWKPTAPATPPWAAQLERRFAGEG